MSKSLRILTSLDELKDTRLSVLGDINLKALGKIMSNVEPYMERDKDDWDALTEGEVSQEDFISRYAEREFKHLCMAPPTLFYFDLKNIIHHAMKDVFDEKVVETSLILTINLFPYRCSKTEMQTLRDVLQMEYGFTNEWFNIRFIYKDWAALNPEVIKSDYDNFYIYNINDWLNANNITDITKLNIPEKTIVSSILLREGFWGVNLKDKLTIDIPEANQTISMPPSKAVKLMTEEYIGLDVIQASYFSLISAKTLNSLQT